MEWTKVVNTSWIVPPRSIPTPPITTIRLTPQAPLKSKQTTQSTTNPAPHSPTQCCPNSNYKPSNKHHLTTLPPTTSNRFTAVKLARASSFYTLTPLNRRLKIICNHHFVASKMLRFGLKSKCRTKMIGEAQILLRMDFWGLTKIVIKALTLAIALQVTIIDPVIISIAHSREIHSRVPRRRLQRLRLRFAIRKSTCSAWWMRKVESLEKWPTS